MEGFSGRNWRSYRDMLGGRERLPVFFRWNPPPGRQKYHCGGMPIVQNVYLCKMARVIAIDYGKKRTGLAWTDPMQLIASALETVPTDRLEARLQVLVGQEDIEGFVLGMPTRLDGTDTDSTASVRSFEVRLRKMFPGRAVELWDEQFTSKMAKAAMLEAGFSKKKRRDKSLVDQISATILLQEYLESRG